MYILNRNFNLTLFSSLPHKHFVKILLLYENPSIRHFVPNDAFQKLQYQSQAGYLRKLEINYTSRNFCAQNTV